MKKESKFQGFVKVLSKVVKNQKLTKKEVHETMMNRYSLELVDKICEQICKEKILSKTKFKNGDYYLLIGHSNLRILRCNRELVFNNILSNDNKLFGIKLIPFDEIGQFELVKKTGRGMKELWDIGVSKKVKLAVK